MRIVGIVNPIIDYAERHQHLKIAYLFTISKVQGRFIGEIQQKKSIPWWDVSILISEL